jgi:apolipoprotein N-acyltransferase
MMLVAVCLGRLVQSWRGEKIQLALPWMGIAAASLIGLLGYGQWRLSQADRIYASSEPLLRVLLVQENTPTIFEINPERNKDSWARYVNLTRQAIVENGPVDLVVWPESTFTANEPWMEIDTEEGMSQDLIQDGITEERLLEVVANYQEAFQSKIALVQAAALGLTPWEPQPVDTSPPHLLLGSDAIAYTNRGMERYNAALFVDPEGKLAGRYGKMHLVMFGEYIPLGWVLQWLRDMFGLHGINAGDRPHSFPIQSSWVAPNICFESMVPHLIARHVRQLAALDQGPDVLINISNDSWFRGSALLDHHLACSILCAVENRRPMLVAANTGISAHISGSGRVIQRTDRLKAQALVAEPRADNRSGLYQDWGAALGWACAWACGAALLTALFNVISASYGRKLEKKPQFG